jgi:hypothetical protein
MNRVKAHYRNYPKTPKDFEKWRLKTEVLFREAKTKLMG